MLTSLFNKITNPPILAGILFISALLVMLLGKMFGASALFAWQSAAAFTLFYAASNSILGLSSKSFKQYWGRSVSSFIGLVIANGLAAYLFSGMSIFEAGSYRSIFIVLAIGYIVFLSIVGLMKNIVAFAMKEEWNAPKQ